MAYNASLANFMESQGIPYAGGLANLPAAQETPMAAQAAPMAAPAPNYTDLITQAYGSIGVKTPDAPGVDYFRTQLQSGAIRPEDFQRSFLTTAAGVTDPTYSANVAKAQELLGGLNKSSVEQAYQTVLGRAGDTEGVKYFTGQLGLGALRPDQLTSTLAQAAIPVAKSLEDRIALQKYLGKDIYAPETYLKGTSGMGYQDVVDLANLNVQDPVKFVQLAAKYGIDPSELLTAKKAVSGQDIPTLKTIEDYFAQGKAGFQPRFQDIVGSVFGSEKERADLESLLKVPAGTLSKTIFDSSRYSKQSLEDIQKTLQESPINRYQEANTLYGILQNVYGLDEKKSSEVTNNLLTGKDTDDKFENFYDDLLKFGQSKQVTDKILLDAAKTNPNSQYFKDNPNAYLIYSPLKEQTGSTGQYDYFKDAPILNANWAIKNMGEKNQIIPHLGQDSEFGWMTNSKYTETIARGPALYGVEFNNRNDIEKAIATEQGIKNGTIIYDSESGTYYNTRTGERAEVPKSDNERKGYVPETANTLAKLQEAAQKVGLNPASYKSAGDLFDALEKKTENFYQVVGRAINWDPKAAQNLGITQTTSGRGGVNQVNAFYEKIGDKLIPIQAKAFEFHDPNTSRGFFGDIAGGIASIPFVAEIASAATGGNPLVYAALKGAQTMALGGDLDDALKSAGLAYLTSSFIPKNITPNVQMALAQNSLVSSLAQSSPQLANFIIDGGTRAVISSGLAAITGQDPEKAALSALVQSGLGTMTKEGLNLTNIPEQYRGIVSNIISSTILGQDPKKSLIGAATGSIKKELSDFVKEQKESVKSDQDKPKTPEIKT